MKKILAFALSFLLVFVGNTASFAMEQIEYYDICSISNEELFNKTFNVTTSIYSRNSNVHDGIVYDYDIIFNEDGNYYASIDFDTIINENTYHATASGKLDKFILENGNTYLSGPLDGNIKIGNNEYKLIVGFQTELESNNISAGITIENGDNLHFAFGNYEMPDEIYNFYQESSTEGKNNQISSKVSRATTSSVGYNNLDVFYDPTYRELSAIVTSDAAALIDNSFYGTSRVYKVWVYFETAEEHANFNVFRSAPKSTESNKLASFVASTIADLISIGCPYVPPTVSYTLLNTLFSGPTTETEIEDEFRLEAYVISDITSGNFDEYPFAVTIEVETSESDYYYFTTSSDLRYVCTNIKNIYYVDAPEDTSTNRIYINE